MKSSNNPMVNTPKPLLTATDAIYGFVGWLTTREAAVTMGGSHDCAEPCELIKQFFDANGLEHTSPEYPHTFKMPVEPPEPRFAVGDKPTPGMSKRLLDEIKTKLKAMPGEVSSWRGHATRKKEGAWVYTDTGNKVSESPNRDCGNCGKPNTKDGHDGCIGELPGVSNACCGHGTEEDTYVQWTDGSRVSGQSAIAVQEAIRGSLAELELAWGVIANAYGGDWDNAPKVWQAAAEKFRDEIWHPALAKATAGKSDSIDPIDPPKQKFAVGDWVEWDNHDWQVTGHSGINSRFMCITTNGQPPECIDANDLKRITFRPFESAKEFDPYRERWSLLGMDIRVPPKEYKDRKCWKHFCEHHVWHSIHGDDWHGQPCGVREVEQ